MGKRGAREGTIRKRSDGLWEARVLLGYQGGRPARPSFYGKSRREVDEKLTSAKRDFQQGTFAVPHRQTVEQFLSHWLENCAEPRVRPRTYVGYAQHVRKHIVPAIGHVRLQRLTPQHVQDLIRIASETLSPRTVAGVRAVLRSALNQAVRWNLIPRNPATLVDLPRARRREFQVMTPEEARRFLTVAADDRLGCLYAVALALGLRLGEALALSWEDVDLDAKTLRVRRGLQRVKGQVTFVEPKSDTSRRTVAIPEFAVDLLKRHRVAQKRERLAAGARWKDLGLVFTTPVGTALDYSNLRKTFRALLKAAGLEPMRIHDLRHTCATLLLAQGVHPKLVQETLGHSQISLTLDTYSHVIPAMREEVAKKMDALLASG